MADKNCGCSEKDVTHTKCGGCPPEPCTCPVVITTDCMTLTEDLVCANIPKGLTETEVLVQLDKYICERFESVENFLKIINVGGGSGIYKGVTVLGKKELRSLVSDGTVTIVENEETISFSINQNNFVRNIIISPDQLPIDYTEQDICDYILNNLSDEERTIRDTDSKFNIIIGGYTPD